MKEKIILFVIGVLVGSVVASLSFYVYSTASNKCNNNMQMPSGEMPQMPNGSNDNFQRPNMPGNNSQNNNFN